MRTIIRTGYELEKAESRSSDPQIFTAVIGGEFTPGTVRYQYESGEGHLCVYTGYSWARLQGIDYNINLSFETRKIIEWAKEKMTREEKLKKLCQTNPAVAKAYEKYQQAEEHLNLIAILSEQ